MKPIFAVVVFIACCGTASAKKYAEPLGESANLRIVLLNPEADALHIAEYDPVACKKGADVGWVSGGRKIDAVRIGMPDSEAPREGILERRIPANRPFAFGTSFIMPKQSISKSLMGAAFPGGASAEALANAQAAICEAPVFTPEPGAFYQWTLHLRPQGCESTISRLQPGSDGMLVRTQLETQRIRFPESPGKPACPALMP